MRFYRDKISLFRPALRLCVALLLFGTLRATAQLPDQATVIRGIDAAVQARINHVASYTVLEHFAVFRSDNQSAPDAEMLLRTEYQKNHGKTFTVVSQRGTGVLGKQILASIMENEKKMSQPGVRENVLINSTNYEMHLRAGPPQMLGGRSCLVLNIRPHHNDASLFAGTLWVDAKDYSIVQLAGKATKSHSLLTGAADVLRQYTLVNGYPMATHAMANTHSGLLGDTTVRVDSTNYQLQLIP